MLNFHKLVNKLLKKSWKILFRNDIFEIIDPDFQEKNITKLNKIIYRLKWEGVIKVIRNGVYVVPNEEDKFLNEVDILDKYYFKLAKKYITENVWASYFIAWKKSLEFYLKDYSLPEKLLVINRSLNKKIKVWDYEIIFKTIKWNVKGKSSNIYNRLSNFVITEQYDDISFKIANLELSLLESAIISNWEWIDISLVNKALKKYKKVIKFDTILELWNLRYISSINRLKDLSKGIDKVLFDEFKCVIKKTWGQFISTNLY